MDNVLVSTFAGSKGGYQDGATLECEFKGPFGICLDLEGNIIIADSLNNKIRKISAGDNQVTTLAGSSEGYADGEGAQAQFHYPTGVCLDKDGNIIVADCQNNMLRRINITNGTVTTLAGSGASGYLDAQGLDAKFQSPFGVCSDNQGNIIVSDRGNHKIRKIDTNGNVTTIAGSVEGLAYGIGLDARFNSPNGVCVNDQGVIIVADGKNHLLRKISPNGVVSTLAGNGTMGFLDAFGENAKFNGPYNVVFDGEGNVIVADCSNNKIRKVSLNGQVSTIAGSSKGLANGSGSTAEFDGPNGLCIDRDGNIIVADYHNNIIRRIVLPKKEKSLSTSEITQIQTNNTNSSNNSTVLSTPFKAGLMHKEQMKNSHRLDDSVKNNSKERLLAKIDLVAKDFDDFKNKFDKKLKTTVSTTTILESKVGSHAMILSELQDKIKQVEEQNARIASDFSRFKWRTISFSFVCGFLFLCFNSPHTMKTLRQYFM